MFNKITEAQTIWVKGREFSLERLFGNAYPQDAKRFAGGALGIFRLAPQDYHRFHIPVDGVMGEPKLIEGEYYTVNPMAIRSALDVYGENVRVLVPIDSKAHGRVMVVCVGAMMVGSTVITRKAGDQVQRAEELGYFKFGGSTILLLFEPGQLLFDNDLVDNSSGALETLVRLQRQTKVWCNRLTQFIYRCVWACLLATIPVCQHICPICRRPMQTLAQRTKMMPSGGLKVVWRQRARPKRQRSSCRQGRGCTKKLTKITIERGLL